MSAPDCPECGETVRGLGICESCGHDIRGEPKVTNAGKPIGQHRPPDEIAVTLPWSCLASDNLKTRRYGDADERTYRQRKEAMEARMVAQAGPGRPLWDEDRTIEAALRFYPPDARERDVTNFFKQIFDAAEGIYYVTDGQVDGGWWRVENIDRENPRLEMEVRVVEEERAA